MCIIIFSNLHSYIVYEFIFLQVIQEPEHGILDGRKSTMFSMNVVGVILLTVAEYTIQEGNNNSDYTFRYLLSLRGKIIGYLSMFYHFILRLFG